MDLDLIVLVADKDAKFALEGLLARHESLRIRPVAMDVVIHPRHDSGVLLECHGFLRLWLKRVSYALVVFDRDDRPSPPPREDLERLVETNLAQNGWTDRSAAVTIDPELEAWFWGDSLHVETALGWTRGRAALDDRLVEREYSKRGQPKPHRPKERFSTVPNNAE
jgi:hypothetical protein